MTLCKQVPAEKHNFITRGTQSIKSSKCHQMLYQASDAYYDIVLIGARKKLDLTYQGCSKH